MIRLAILNDLKDIVDIYNQTISLKNVTADTERVSVESRKDWFNSFNEDRPIWVFEKEKKVVAWLSFKSFYGRPAYKFTVEIGMYIDESERSNGIGSEMLLYAHQYAKEKGINTILAFVFKNNENSTRFFLKNGYEIYGNLPGIAEIENIEIDLLILGKKI